MNFQESAIRVSLAWINPQAISSLETGPSDGYSSDPTALEATAGLAPGIQRPSDRPATRIISRFSASVHGGDGGGVGLDNMAHFEMVADQALGVPGPGAVELRQVVEIRG